MSESNERLIIGIALLFFGWAIAMNYDAYVSEYIYEGADGTYLVCEKVDERELGWHERLYKLGLFLSLAGGLIIGVFFLKKIGKRLKAIFDI